MIRKHRLILSVGIVAAVTILFPAQLEAQEWGVSSKQTLAIHPWAFVPWNSADTDRVEKSGYGRYCTDGCGIVAPVSLPDGVRVTEIALDAYDSDSTGYVACYFATCAAKSDTWPYTAIITGVAFDGGDATPIVVLDPPVTVDNTSYIYGVVCNLSGGTSNTRLRGFRLFYELQISPDPATATFSDVPTDHLFFQHVEALFASGITAGCGGGNYCPDDPLTRGQMAVFLAKALGLHWPGGTWPPPP